MKIETTMMKDAKAIWKKEFDYIDEIIIKDLVPGVRYVSFFSLTNMIDGEIRYSFKIGLPNELIKNYAGDKKFCVTYNGYGNSGWYDSDNIDDLLVHVLNFYQNHESLIKKYSHKYTVCIKKGGAQLSDHPTLASAIREIELLEQQDKENNEYEENYYDIRRIDCSSTRYYNEVGTFLSEYNEEHDIYDFISKKLPSSKELADFLGVSKGAVSQYNDRKKELMIYGLWVQKELQKGTLRFEG